MALLRQNGKPVAFVSLMATAQKREACIGIMRHTDEASTYAMEFLFTRLALDLKEAGYAMLSLGMAPLAGLGPRAAVFALAPAGRTALGAWRPGSIISRGLRSFKGKFQPVWEPRYLAATGTVGPFLALADVAALAGGAPKVETA